MTEDLDASDLPDDWASALREHGCVLSMLSALVADVYKPCESTKVRPLRQDVFRSFHLTPLNEVRVVILGQDPYPSPSEAHGLAFSVPNPLPAPRSLRTIYRNLENDPRTPFSRPESGDLTPWASNGVLLLNTALTVVQGDPGSHARRWVDFTGSVLKVITDQRPHVAFLLWGSHAIRKAESVSIDEPPHRVIRSAHPAARGRTKERRFRDVSPFAEANDFLTKHDLEPVLWGALTPSD